MKILVLETDPDLAMYWRRGLQRAGFVVDSADDGDAGLRAVRTGTHDLVVCEATLPYRDGYSLVAELRRTGTPTPILLVVPENDVDARVRALDLGADDCLSKPVAFTELLARIRAVLRRAPTPTADVYRVSDLVVDAWGRRVERGGVPLNLRPREFMLLQFLLRHAGEVVSQAMIADGAWGRQFERETTVNAHVYRLRQKIEPPGTTRLIHTVHGVGYVLEDRSAEQSESRETDVGVPVHQDLSSSPSI